MCCLFSILHGDTVRLRVWLTILTWLAQWAAEKACENATTASLWIRSALQIMKRPA